MRTAVIILNYNGAKHLTTYLPSVIEHGEGAEVYVIDNASTDDSLEVLKAFPTVKLIQLDINLGFAGGYNVGLMQVEADLFVLINSDVRVTENWLPPIVKAFDDKEVHACQPKIKSDRHPDQFEYAGAAGGFMDRLGYPFCRGRLFNIEEQDNGQYNTDLDCFWAGGACIAVRKTAFFATNGFDQRYFAHMEEIDLCWRMQLNGGRIRVATGSTVYHLGGGTLSVGSPRKTFLNFRNNLLTLSKNLPFATRLWLIPTRLVLDGIAGVKFLLELQPRHTLAVIKAHFSFYNMRLFNTGKQWQPAKQLPFSALTGAKPVNVVTEFFLKKKRKFSELD